MMRPRHARLWSAGLLLCAALGLALMLPAGQKKSPARPKPDLKTKPAETAVPFLAGERLDYRVLWSSFSVNAATVRLTVTERRPFYGREAWHFQGVAHTVDTMRLLFALDDQFDSYSNLAELVSLQYEMHLNEQGKKEDAVLRITSDADPAPGAGSAVRVLPGTRDPLGLLYYLRTVDWQSNAEAQCPVFDGRKLYEVKARLGLERGQVSVAAGRYAASRIDLRVYERGSELGQTRFSVWLAHDRHRTPILFEAEVPLGTARVELVRAE